MERKQDRNEAIVEALRDGATLVNLAETYGISPQRVYQIGAEKGIRSRHLHPRLDPEKVDRILDLFGRGMPISHIAEAVQTAAKTVCNHLSAHGLYAPEKRSFMVWDDTKDALIRKHYNSYPGAARELAERFGTTRNAIIGRANRLGLQRSK